MRIRPRTRRSILASVAVPVTVASLVLGLAVPAGAIPPAVPTGSSVTIQAATYDAELSWTPTPGAAGHELICESQGQDDLVRNNLSGTASSAVVRLAPGYWGCSIRARNAGLELSVEQLNFGAIYVPPLAAPTGLTGVAYSGVVTLNWTKPTPGIIDGWHITSMPPGADAWVTMNESPTATLTGLPVGVSHTFSVTPYRLWDISKTYLGTVSATTPALTVKPTPAAPTITGVYPTIDEMDVEWTPPTDTGGKPITGYRITLGQWEDPPRHFDVPASLTSLHIDGVPDLPGLIETPLTPGFGYPWIEVQAKNVNGYGAPGTWADIPLDMTDPASPVQNLYVYLDPPGFPNPNTINVGWTPPAFLPLELQPPTVVQYEFQLVGPAGYNAPGFPQTGIRVDHLTLPDGWYQVRVRVNAGISPARWATRWVAKGTPCDAVFSDVTGPPFCTAISWLVREGIANGFPDGTFKPTQAVSRQSMAAFLYRAKGSPLGLDPQCSAPPFPDVAVSSPFCGEIDWMVDEGIAAGFGDGGFHPTAAVSRQATAAFLYRASSHHVGVPLGVCEEDLFSDVPMTHPFCYEIEALRSTGFADGSFRPTTAVSRQSMASFLSKWLP